MQKHFAGGRGALYQSAFFEQVSFQSWKMSWDSDLFVRTINGTELTEAGKIYLKYAKGNQASSGEPWSMS